MLPSFILSLFVGATAAAAADVPGRAHFTSHSYHETVMNRYLAIWAGDLSLVNSTFAPSLTFSGDRFPTGAHGSAQLAPFITSPGTFAGFVQQTRANFDEYRFSVQRWAGEGVNIAVRWTLEGVVGESFKAVPT